MTIYYKILVGLALAVVLAAVLFGCARPQPYGEDIWIGLREVQK